jgi:hypothetical protein
MAVMATINTLGIQFEVSVTQGVTTSMQIALKHERKCKEAMQVLLFACWTSFRL